MEFAKDFLDAMIAGGCAPDDTNMVIEADNHWHYYTLSGDRRTKKAGAYSLCVEGDFAFGCFLNRRSGDIIGWHNVSEGRKLSKEERKFIADKIEENKRAREKELSDKWDNTKAVVEFELDCSLPVELDHPYLVKKGLAPDSDMRMMDGELIIPIRDRFGAVWTYQRILPNGLKFYKEGGKINGCFYAIGYVTPEIDKVIICEGWATGKSLNMACDIPVVVAFDSGKLKAVAQEIRRLCPNAKIIICGDNDQWRVNQKGELENIGVIKAEQAAVTVGGFCIIPQFKPESLINKPTDFDDLRMLEGIDEVRAQVNKARTDVVVVEDAPFEITPFDDVVHHVQGEVVDWEQQVIVKSIDRSGAIKEIKDIGLNYYILVKHHPAFDSMFRWDAMAYKVRVVNGGGIYPKHVFKEHVLNDSDITQVDYRLQKLGIGINGSDAKTRTAIYQVAQDDPMHPIRDFFDGLIWDGEERVKTWLRKFTGAVADDREYVDEAGMTWLVAAVKRIYEPGCKFDHMLILEGGQGAGKSTLLHTLSDVLDMGDENEYFTDSFSMKNVTNKDELAKLTGKFIVECAELSGMNKADRDEMTNFVTQMKDVYRAPYGRETLEYPRQFVLAGTNNPTDGIFTDPTGYRRFWCVKCGNIDLSSFRFIRSQLWAEAVHLYKTGYSLERSKAFYDLAVESGKSRILQDDWHSTIMNYISGKDWVDTKDILVEALRFDMKAVTQRESRRVNRILVQERWEKKKRTLGRTQVWGWQNPLFVEQEIEF